MPISQQTRDPVLPKNGDGMIIVRSDGTTGMLICGMDPQKLKDKVENGEELTDEDISHLDVANRVLALSRSEQPKDDGNSARVRQRPRGADTGASGVSAVRQLIIATSPAPWKSLNVLFDLDDRRPSR